MSLAVRAEDLRFAYRPGALVLDLPHLEIEAGERVFVSGPSGSGKTTLLGLLTGVLAAASGRLEVLGQDLVVLTPAARDALRGERMGYVFQMFNLLPFLDVRQNILLPCRLNRRRREKLGDGAEAAVEEIAEALSIRELLDEPAGRLSVGQQQRVAAARALLGDPELLIADEPTSALDDDRRRGFLELLFDRCRRGGTTLVFVSHDRRLADLFDRTLDLRSLNRIQGGEA